MAHNENDHRPFN